ncbi:hypothetical protein [Nocardioides sp.]|uniref:hypothetical protein n=1 Tax=Nocardioides sp. TaxID=35761 RepID=UPI0026145237|nr:hypothetical protein [Nocardioides sp.]MDI6908646.1 hypothetical protein [Nocardioides sp.]
MTSGNALSATRHNLAWPTAPAWAARWQAKIDAARLPVQRADAAWRALRAAANKARLEHDAQDALFTQVADWLIERANALAPKPPAKPAPRHTVDRGSGEITPVRGCPCKHCTWVFLVLE